MNSPVKSADEANTSPISTLDAIVQESAIPGDRVQKVVESSSEVHERLHSSKASSLNNLPTDETDSIGASSSSSDIQILSTSAPSSNGGREPIDLSSTGTHLNGTGQRSPPPPPPPAQSTSSATSDNVFETQSETECETKNKADDDVFRTEKESERKAEAASSNGAGTEDLNPTFAKLMAEQRRKSEELKLKGK